MYWNRDPRGTAGGHFYCSVKARERSVRVYDENHIYRLEKCMKQAARKRRETIERNKSSLATDQKTKSTFVGTAFGAG